MKKKQHRGKADHSRLTLKHLTYQEAVKALLSVKPKPKPKKKG